MAVPSQPLLILYASQTGNAQDVAELIGREAERRYFQPRVLPADAYLRTSLAQFPGEAATIFIVSTTGQGDPPENITEFWKFLRRKSLPPDSLSSMATAVFGLGDSGYLKYNTMAKLLYRRLEALGARALVPLGLGDDQHKSGYDAELDLWLPQLWKALRNIFPLPATAPAAAGGTSSSMYPEEPAPEDTSGILKPKYTVTLLPNPPPLDKMLDTNENIKKFVSGSEYEAAVAAAAAIERLDASISGLIASNASSSGSLTSGRYSAAEPVFATLEKNQRVTAEDHFQDVRLFNFSFPSSSPLASDHLSPPHAAVDGNFINRAVEFDPGDIIAVWPQQREESIQRFCSRCELDPDAWVAITPPASTSSSSSSGSTKGVMLPIRALVSGVLDIDAAIPRRSFFQALAQHCPPGLHADRLHYFASAQGRDDLHEYCRREGRTVLEILTDFSSTKLSLEWLLSYCPRLRPRRFSVASSLELHPNTAQLLVAVAEWTTPGRRRRKGLCSTWLAGLNPGARVAMWVERGALKLPLLQKDALPQTAAAPLLPPVILIGPGTGVAPFRSYLQYRSWFYQKQQQEGQQENESNKLQAQYSIENGVLGDAGTSNMSTKSECVLVFGCRHERGDYYCRKEWEEMQAVGVLAGPGGGLITAFSRDTEKKIYVQHRIQEYGKEIWELLQRGAVVFVAGSADKMPVEVEAAFKAVVAEHGALEWGEAEKYVKRMEATGRYQVECWS